jgi:acyl phosphate:glycerol-3-phosphate acyltransferase
VILGGEVELIITLLWILLAFVSGSLPFSVWIGRLALRTDIRGLGDGNPGATNVFRAGGRAWGVLAMLLDVLKAAVPVGIARFGVGIDSWGMALVALAPIAGHAFSPLLGFQGGKALASTVGSWTGLTLWLVPTLLGLLFAIWYLVLSVEGWAVVAAMLCLLPVLILLADSMLIAVWAGNTAILSWKHRADLSRRPRLRLSLSRR